jgi:hypothetical protein
MPEALGEFALVVHPRNHLLHLLHADLVFVVPTGDHSEPVLCTLLPGVELLAALKMLYIHGLAPIAAKIYGFGRHTE